MAMMSAYFDESGHPDQGRALVVAGFASSDDQWIHFEREWAQTLLDFEAPNVFHAVDFMTSSKGYRDWPFPKRKDFLRRLLGIIGRRTTMSFSSAIHLSDFNAVNREAVLAEVAGFPYPLAAITCVQKTAGWARARGHSAQVRYVFEDGPRDKGQLFLLMERHNMPTPRFRKKEEAMPCQAADLLAWSHHEALTKFYRDERSIDGNEVYEQFAQLPNDWAEFHEPDLLEICRLEKVFERAPEFRYALRFENKGGERVPLLVAAPKGHKGQKIERMLNDPTHSEPPFKRKTDYAVIKP